jgi:hypothetical protein
MGITYNKEYKPKDRRVVTRGPRDIQARRISNTDSSGLVNELRAQVERLQKQLLEKPTSGYTPEQVDAEILKAIKIETLELNKKHNDEKSALLLEVEKYKYEIKSLKELIASKDEQIKALQNNSPKIDNKLTDLLSEATKKIEEMSLKISSGGEKVASSNRPQMETLFVDPIEKESKVEKHFEIEDITIDEKDKIYDKVNKLKSIMGKLPNKK